MQTIQIQQDYGISIVERADNLNAAVVRYLQHNTFADLTSQVFNLYHNGVVNDKVLGIARELTVVREWADYIRDVYSV